MALSTEHVTPLWAGFETSPEWKEAWDRVLGYLDALRQPVGPARDRLLIEIFENALARKREEPFASATGLAFEEAQRALEQAWGHMATPGTNGQQRSVEGRLRICLGEVDAAGGRLASGPALQAGVITPKPLEWTRWGRAVVSLAERVSSSGKGRFALGAFGLATLAGLILASF